MTTAPQPRGPRPWRRRAQRFLHTLQTQLTRQFITRNRRMAFVLSVVTIAIAVAAVHVSAWGFSPGVLIPSRGLDPAVPGRRPAAVAQGCADLLRVRRGGSPLRRARGHGRRRDH